MIASYSSVIKNCSQLYIDWRRGNILSKERKFWRVVSNFGK